MNRRHFLKEAGMAGALVAVGGTAMYARCAWARSKYESQLVSDAQTTLTAAAHDELAKHPKFAEDEIKRYFDGMCLNVEGFVGEVGSEAFRERVQKCRNRQERNNEVMAAFCRRVKSGADILEHVRGLARTVGTQLDRNWHECAKQVALSWNLRVKGDEPRLDPDEFPERLTPLVRRQLEAAVRVARSAAHPPALGETLEEIGASALLLLPLATGRAGVAGVAVSMPLFVYNACRHLFDYVADLKHQREADYQQAVSQQVAKLGNQVAAEFGTEFRRRLKDLHAWQEAAVREAARRQAEDRIGYL